VPWPFLFLFLFFFNLVERLLSDDDFVSFCRDGDS
jgi:hypothetical protein